jgi:triosephosphate isomerase (TIM)
MIRPRPTPSGRPILVAGNWKMHLGPEETETFLHRLALPEHPPEVQVLLFPTALSLSTARSWLVSEDTRGEGPTRPRIQLGVQNLHWAPQGAFTGEISAELAAAAGATFALVGHSERRHLFGETPQETALKVGAATRAGLTPVLCVGETLEERRGGALSQVLASQLGAVLEAHPNLAAESLVLAYEPVWAIGTGESATPHDAHEAHALLRDQIRERRGARFAQQIPILYGGSVTPENARELMASPEVDGVLVGGASLDPERFARITGCAFPG